MFRFFIQLKLPVNTHMAFPDFLNITTPDLLFLIASVLNLVGLAGTIIPGLPGPPLSFVGLVLCCFAAPNPVIIVLTAIMFLFVVAVTVIDFVVPGWLTNMDVKKLCGELPLVFLSDCSMHRWVSLQVRLSELSSASTRTTRKCRNH